MDDPEEVVRTEKTVEPPSTVVITRPTLPAGVGLPLAKPLGVALPANAEAGPPAVGDGLGVKADPPLLNVDVAEYVEDPEEVR